MPNDDGTALLSWCAVTGAEGYNVFLDNQYQRTLGSSTYQLWVDYNAGDEYQVAWYADGNYPAKSAVVQAPGDETPPTPMTDLDSLTKLEADSSASDDDVEIYFTRHAEKMTQLAEQEDGSFIEVCGDDKCAEILNAKGELRAELLADVFRGAGITGRLTHAFSSHKIRTRQTIEMIAAEAGLSGDNDKNADDGIQEFPVSNPDATADATELDPESTSPSEAPVIEALTGLPAGSVALVAGHSGTLYDIMAGIGLTDVCFEVSIDSCNESRYPVDSKFKVKNFGDIWKVTLSAGETNFVYRVNFQPAELAIDELAQ
jgi:phosphohistidine phosphatase SixA